MPAESASAISATGHEPDREKQRRSLQLLGILCGFTAGSVAGRGGSADETGVDWRVADRHFADHGGGSISSAMEFAGAGSGNLIGPRRCAARASSDHLGVAGGLPVGRSEHTDDFCDSRYRPEHRFSSVEFQQHPGDFLGILVFQ